MACFSTPLTLVEYRTQLVSVPAGDGSQFHIGRTPVTKGMWEEFCEATGFPIVWSMKINGGMRDKDRPVVVVSWDDTQKYLKWAKMTLPTVQQWELAAKHFDIRIGFAEWCQDLIGEDEIKAWEDAFNSEHPQDVFDEIDLTKLTQEEKEEFQLLDEEYASLPPVIMRATRGWPIWASSWDWQDARRYDLGFRAVSNYPPR